jgi:hypothetical protein
MEHYFLASSGISYYLNDIEQFLFFQNRGNNLLLSVNNVQ